MCTVFNASSPSSSYDYAEIAKSIDFFFIMAYDETGRERNGPNAGYHMTQGGTNFCPYFLLLLLLFTPLLPKV